MKLLLIPFFLFAFFITSNLLAQKYDNDIKLGVGLIHYPSPNASSAAIYGEYSRPFFPKSFLGLSAMAALPVSYLESEEERKLYSYHFAMNLYFNLIEQLKQAFRLGLGLTAGIFDEDWKVIDTGQMGRDHSFQPGLGILMEYNLIFNKTIIFGVTAKGLLYGDNKTSIFVGLQGGFRF